MSLVINEIDRGANPLYNNLHLYRKYYDQRSILRSDPITGIIDTDNSEFRIFYFQYYKDINNDIILETFRDMHYRVMDVPGHPNLTVRGTQLFRTPIDGSATGLLDGIETILGILPFDVPNGYILNT